MVCKLSSALECKATSELTEFNTKKLSQDNFVMLRFNTPLDHSEEL